MTAAPPTPLTHPAAAAAAARRPLAALTHLATSLTALPSPLSFWSLRCERNYVTTEYVAEFWNALSSLPITLFAVIGYLAGKKYARAETR